MANKLLDLSALGREPAHPTHQENVMPKEKVVKDERQCLYRGLDSHIFDGPDAVEAALEDGWCEHPDQAKAEMPDDETERTGQDSLEALHIEHAQTVESLNAASARVDELEAGTMDLVDQRDSFKDEFAKSVVKVKELTAENTSLKGQVTKLQKAAKK